MKLIVAFGERAFTPSVIVSGLYAVYAFGFEMLEAYRYRQGQRTT